MAYSRLLLLLIGVISSHLPDVQARDIDFWCNIQARRRMEKKIVCLKRDMANCGGSDTLSSSVQLPCVWVNSAEWANKTLQQKRAEVVGALQMFQDGVQGVRNQTTLQCQIPLLESWGRLIANHLDIVKGLQLQNDLAAPSHSAVKNCSSQTSLDEVLAEYKMLLWGKLNRLAIDLKNSICKEEHRTATSNDVTSTNSCET